MGETVDLMRVTVEAGETYHGIVVDYLAPSAAVMRNSYGHYRFEAINDPDDPRLAGWDRCLFAGGPQREGACRACRSSEVLPAAGAPEGIDMTPLLGRGLGSRSCSSWPRRPPARASTVADSRSSWPELGPAGP